MRDQLQTLDSIPESHSLSAENDDFPYEIRDKLVGLGSRPRYRAVFTVKGNDVFVLTVQAGEQAAIEPDEVEFDTDAS